MSEKKLPIIVFVTGMSGAGKSVALKTFEDIGFEAIDNIPLSILPQLLACNQTNLATNLVIGIDIRNRDFSFSKVIEQIDIVKGTEHSSVKFLFLDCDDEILQRRFTETRRRHPAQHSRLITDNIKYERQLISNLREYADLVIDSSKLNHAELRQIICGHFSTEFTANLAVTILSFSFKLGLPREADLVFDVRFLSNPFYDLTIRHLSGQDDVVKDYIQRDPIFTQFIDNLKNLILPLLPRYHIEGKSYLTIAIGCTGGQHRSVYVAEKLAEDLGSLGFITNLLHRDLCL